MFFRFPEQKQPPTHTVVDKNSSYRKNWIMQIFLSLEVSFIFIYRKADKILQLMHSPQGFSEADYINNISTVDATIFIFTTFIITFLSIINHPLHVTWIKNMKKKHENKISRFSNMHTSQPNVDLSKQNEED